MELPRRTLGRTGLEVTTIGFGAMQIGGRDSELAGRVLNEVLDAGINLIDTAPGYKNSEQWIGQSIAHRRDAYVLASKCRWSPEGAEPTQFSREAILGSIQLSLQRLRTDRIDLMQLHSVSPDVPVNETVVEALQTAQRAGKVRFLGITGWAEGALAALRMGCYDTVQLTYHVHNTDAEEAIVLCHRHNLGILIKSPLSMGGLVRAKADDAQAVDRLERLDALSGQLGLERIDASLHFVFSRPDVSSVLGATTNVEHLRHNTAIARQAALPADAWLRLPALSVPEADR